MRVATFNLKHGAEAQKYKANPEDFAEACEALRDIDILALQEVDKGVIRSGRADLAALAAKATGMKVIFEPTMQFRSGLYGNALLVRGKVNYHETLRMKGGPRFRLTGRRIEEPRNAIVARVSIADFGLSVVATHLATQRKISRQQLHEVVRELEDMPEPRMLLGDLNMSDTAIASSKIGARLEFVQGYSTFPADNPNRQIDHIAVQGLTICSVETRRLPVSDHLALVAEVN